jgi:hypothetical protein
MSQKEPLLVRLSICFPVSVFLIEYFGHENPREQSAIQSHSFDSERNDQCWVPSKKFWKNSLGCGYFRLLYLPSHNPLPERHWKNQLLEGVSQKLKACAEGMPNSRGW